jgi:putative flavoprotein involved in K+ transport
VPVQEENDVVVIGGGQAGLAVSRELTAAGVEHVVLERDRIGGSWAERWDSFHLVTPNHTIRLPGGGYEGEEPHGFLARDEVVRYLERYASSFAAPVLTGVHVLAVRRAGRDGGWRLTTPTGDIMARTVIVATGAFQRAHEPPAAPDLRRWLPVLPASKYRSPSSLPDGPVLVVGSGQTGTQIAEELTLAGRRVILSCGRAPWMDRRIDGRDMVDWLLDTGLFEQTRADLAGPDAVFVANVQATGAGGGHDLHYRTLAAMGVQLAGRLVAAQDGIARFADDLAASVAFGDAARAELCRAIRASCEASGRPVPSMPDPPPFDVPGLPSVPVRELGSVVLATGYRPAYSETILHREAFDSRGFPLQHDGASTVLPRLFFVGVHFLRKRKSSLFLGVGEDAAVVARQVADRSS